MTHPPALKYVAKILRIVAKSKFFKVGNANSTTTVESFNLLGWKKRNEKLNAQMAVGLLRAETDGCTDQFMVSVVGASRVCATERSAV